MGCKVIAGKRIDGYPAVLIGGVGHQMQLLDDSGNDSRKHTSYRRQVNHKLLDKIPLQFLDRNIADSIFAFEESRQTLALFGIGFESGGFPVFTDSLFTKLLQIIVEGL